jgi:hypothetical protein
MCSIYRTFRRCRPDAENDLEIFGVEECLDRREQRVTGEDVLEDALCECLSPVQSHLVWEFDGVRFLASGVQIHFVDLTDVDDGLHGAFGIKVEADLFLVRHGERCKTESREEMTVTTVLPVDCRGRRFVRALCCSTSKAVGFN